MEMPETPCRRTTNVWTPLAEWQRRFHNERASSGSRVSGRRTRKTVQGQYPCFPAPDIDLTARAAG